MSYYFFYCDGFKANVRLFTSFILLCRYLNSTFHKLLVADSVATTFAVERDAFDVVACIVGTVGMDVNLTLCGTNAHLVESGCSDCIVRCSRTIGV